MVELIPQNFAAIGLILLVVYCLGAIPFGLIITRLAGLGDIRAIGSGNIGATNVLRTGRRNLAILTLVLDAAKGAAAVVLVRHYGDSFPAILSELAMIAVVLGHMFPITLRFRGGKGVATSLGALLVLTWSVGLLVAGVWLGVAFVTRYSSLAALLASASAPLIACVLGASWQQQACILILAMMIWMRHHANLRRLWQGTESRMSVSRGARAP